MQINLDGRWVVADTAEILVYDGEMRRELVFKRLDLDTLDVEVIPGREEWVRVTMLDLRRYKEREHAVRDVLHHF